MAQIKRGEIYYTDLGETLGSEQDGYRPCIVIQNDIGNLHSPTVIIASLTTQNKKANIPTHVFISSACGLDNDSIALAEQIRTVDKNRLGAYVGCISETEQVTLDNALAISIGLEVSA